MNNISYIITVYNEIEELQRLLKIIVSVLTDKDELIVVHTYKNEKDKMANFYAQIQNMVIACGGFYHNFYFQNKFADMKNFANQLATKHYIINFDADEFASFETIQLWKQSINNKNDLYYLPRINTVERYTLADIQKYKWQINNNGWINWPDYQPRIYKNSKKIQWVGDVHEHLVGFESAAALTADPKLAIIHNKTIEKQRKQNQLYDTINRQYVRS